MVALLDTDICIHLIREKPESIVERLTELAVGDVAISTITLAELEYGVSKSAKQTKNRQALDQFLMPLAVVDFDRSATAVYGRLRALLEKKGQMIGAMDLLIAAHAMSLNVRLVTHNIREFTRVPGLRVDSWN
jgi:tRNA(fMet)-specific endonuclease VapC